MTVLNLADALKVGGSDVDRVYLGSDLVWEPASDGPSYVEEVMADTPLGYWRQGDPSGTTMTDSSGNGRHGTYASVTLGATGLVADDTDTAADYTNSYATVPDGAWLDVSTFTAEALIQPDGISGYRGVITRDGSSARGWNLYLVDGKLHVFQPGNPVGEAVLTGGTTLALAQTYHVALTADGTTVRLYVNGVLDGSRTATLPNISANALMIGASQAGIFAPTFGFDGRIDEVAYYGTALSAARLLAHAEAAAGEYVEPTYTLDTVTLDSTYGDSFDGATLAARWSRQGYVDADDTVADGTLTVVGKGPNNYYWQTPPSGNWTATMRARASHRGDPSFRMFGIVAYSTTGAGVAMGAYNNPEGCLVGGVSGGAYASGFVTNGASTSASVTSGVPVWYQLEKVGTAYRARMSVDGATWQAWTATLTNSSTIARVGFGAFLGAADRSFNIDWFNIVPA